MNKNLFIIVISCILVISCSRTTEQKKDFIHKQQKKTIDVITKKYGELILPEILEKNQIKDINDEDN